MIIKCTALLYYETIYTYLFTSMCVISKSLAFFSLFCVSLMVSASEEKMVSRKIIILERKLKFL